MYYLHRKATTGGSGELESRCLASRGGVTGSLGSAAERGAGEILRHDGLKRIDSPRGAPPDRVAPFGRRRRPRPRRLRMRRRFFGPRRRHHHQHWRRRGPLSSSDDVVWALRGVTDRGRGSSGHDDGRFQSDHDQACCGAGESPCYLFTWFLVPQATRSKNIDVKKEKEI